MNRKESKVSVILPIYNMEAYLEGSINSVLAQTYENWELVIIDNCSTDASASIARKFASSDSRIIFSENSSNVGPLINHNLCIDKSTGDYIELFGGDDLFENNCLKRFVDYLDVNQSAAMVTSARRHIDAEGQVIEEIHAAEGTQLIASRHVVKSNLVDLTNWIVSPVMYRARYKGKGFDNSLILYADIDYWFKILADGDLGYIDEILFNYRVHPASGTTRLLGELNFVPDILRMAKKHIATFSDNEISVDELESIVAKKLVDLRDYAITSRGLTSSFYDDPSLFMPKNDLRSLEEIRQELADFKKAIFITLSYASSLRVKLEAENVKRSDLYVQLLERLKAQKEGRKSDVDAYEAQSEEFRSGMRELEGRISTLTQQNKRLLSENQMLTEQSRTNVAKAGSVGLEFAPVRKTMSGRIASMLQKFKC